jgi:hypothetical protein
MRTPLPLALLVSALLTSLELSAPGEAAPLKKGSEAPSS